MTDLLAAMRDSLSAQIRLSDEIVQAIRWVMSNGRVEHHGSDFVGTLYPASVSEPCTKSGFAFVTKDPDYMPSWLGSDEPQVLARVGIIARTGFDGSRAAIWIDDEGKQHFVHLGSGSGSTFVGIIASNAIDFLRFAAIGYEEHCWVEHYSETAEEYHASWYEDDEDVPPYRPPVEFRTWVENSFGVSIPARAAEIVSRTPGMDDDWSDDPFWQWVRKVTR
jgi:hypothetical protein